METTYRLNLERAAKSLAKLNASSTFVAAEFLLHENFGRIGELLSSGKAGCLVVLVDGLWRTQLFREAGAADRISERVTRSADRIQEELSKLKRDDLAAHPARVYQTASALLPVFMGQSGGGERQNYSFASKFLHWCSPHHFPIVDAKARRAISRFQRRHRKRSGRVRSSIAAMGGLTYLAEYERWVTFYSDLVAALSAAEIERVITADFKSQPSSLSRRNTILRALDKYFYFEGGGRGLGRIQA